MRANRCVVREASVENALSQTNSEVHDEGASQAGKYREGGSRTGFRVSWAPLHSQKQQRRKPLFHILGALAPNTVRRVVFCLSSVQVHSGITLWLYLQVPNDQQREARFLVLICPDSLLCSNV